MPPFSLPVTHQLRQMCLRQYPQKHIETRLLTGLIPDISVSSGQGLISISSRAEYPAVHESLLVQNAIALFFVVRSRSVSTSNQVGQMPSIIKPRPRLPPFSANEASGPIRCLELTTVRVSPRLRTRPSHPVKSLSSGLGVASGQ